MNEKISVAMAVYQGEKYLGVQLDSILAQLGAEDEVVVSYDVSKDRTLDVLQEYAQKDSRVKIYENTVPGVTGNFNNAISHCTGDYIYISDQDDKWVEGKVKRVQKAFAQGADMVIHNGTHTNPELEPIGDPFFTMYRIGDGKLQNLMKPRYSGCCMAFTRQMQQIILPIPEIKAYDHWVGMVGECFGKIAYVDDVLLLHRLHGYNVTPEHRRSLKIVLETRSKLVCHLIARKLRHRNGGKA